MHEKMKIKHVLNNSNLLSKIVRKYKSKTKLFVNKSEMFYFRFFEQLERIRVTQNVFYFHSIRAYEDLFHKQNVLFSRTIFSAKLTFIFATGGARELYELS